MAESRTFQTQVEALSHGARNVEGEGEKNNKVLSLELNAQSSIGLLIEQPPKKHKYC